jgi:hypothetical protein
VAEDAISIGGVDLADPQTYEAGMPFEAFRALRERAPVAWHPHGSARDGTGFWALTAYDDVLAGSRHTVEQSFSRLEHGVAGGDADEMGQHG